MLRSAAPKLHINTFWYMLDLLRTNKGVVDGPEYICDDWRSFCQLHQ